MTSIFTRASVRRRAGYVGALVVATLALAACDPSHPFEDFRVKVRLRDDGTAAVAADVFEEGMAEGSAALDPGLFSIRLGEAIDIGDVVGEPRVYDEEFGFPTVGVEVRADASEPITVEFAAIVDTLTDAGVAPDAAGFISVCNAAGRGGASGRSVQMVERSSCGIWEGALSEVPTAASVTLDPAVGRDWYIPATVLVSLSAIGLAGVWGMSSRFAKGRRVGEFAVGLAVLGLVLFWATVTIRRMQGDSTFRVGQAVGDPKSASLGIVALGGAAAMLLGAGVQAIRRHRAPDLVAEAVSPTATPAD